MNVFKKFISILVESLADFFRYLKNWTYNYLTKITGNKSEDYKITTIIAAIVIVLIITIFSLVGAQSIFSYFLVKDQNLARVNSYGGIKISPPIKKDTAEVSKCNLTNGNWNKWLGKVSQDVDDDTLLVLPTKSSGVLFGYDGDIEDFSNCEFIFTPRGSLSINYVISLDGIYQVVIGDNDFSTITLRSTNSIEGELKPVKETNTLRTRPRLLEKIKPGTNVRVILNQSFIDSENYKLSVRVEYTPDSDFNGIKQQDFVWIFSPSPLLLKAPKLSVGLVRNSKDKTDISANFISPKIKSISR